MNAMFQVEKPTFLFVEDNDDEFRQFRDQALRIWPDARIEHVRQFRLDAVLKRIETCDSAGRPVDVILLDLRNEKDSPKYEDWSSFSLLRQMRAHEAVGQLLPVVACSKWGFIPGQGREAGASVAFLSQGGTDFFDKSDIVKAEDATSWHLRLGRWVIYARKIRGEPVSVRAVQGTLEGGGRFIADLRGWLERLIRNHTRFLCLYGETGVGKGRAVGYIKELLSLKDSDTALIQISSIPENLLEAYLFGHVPGAWTDAKAGRSGALAGKKLIYLDEFQRIPTHLQVKLLRVLRERQFTRVGDDRVETIAEDAMFVVSLDAPPEVLVRRGILIPDIAGRLPLSVLEVLPLRARKDEIKGLVKGFLRQRYQRDKRGAAGDTAPIIDIEADALRSIEESSFDWPYNIAQLEGFVEYLCDERVGDLVRSSDVERALECLTGSELETALRVLRRYAFDRTLAAEAWRCLGRPGTTYLRDSPDMNTFCVRRILCRVAAEAASEKDEHERHLEEQLLGSDRYDNVMQSIVRREIRDLQGRLADCWSDSLRAELLRAAPESPWRVALARAQATPPERSALKAESLGSVAKLLSYASVPAESIRGVALLLALHFAHSPPASL